MHDGGVQYAFSVVRMNAGFQSQVPGHIWQAPALMCGESDEECAVVFLNMRQVAAAIVIPSLHSRT
jgi:hypothetical protein